MAKIKNTGTQPRGFYDVDGTHVVVAPEEVEISMTEADYDKCVAVAESEEPPPYEISGGAAGPKKPATAKEKAAAEQKKADDAAKKAEEEAKAAEAEEKATAKKKA